MNNNNKENEPKRRPRRKRKRGSATGSRRDTARMFRGAGVSAARRDRLVQHGVKRSQQRQYARDARALLGPHRTADLWETDTVDYNFRRGTQRVGHGLRHIIYGRGGNYTRHGAAARSTMPATVPRTRTVDEVLAMAHNAHLPRTVGDLARMRMPAPLA